MSRRPEQIEFQATAGPARDIKKLNTITFHSPLDRMASLPLSPASTGMGA